MTRDEKIEFIENLGYTTYQAQTIYDEMGCISMETMEEIENAADEWWKTEKDMERCSGVC